MDPSKLREILQGKGWSEARITWLSLRIKWSEVKTLEDLVGQIADLAVQFQTALATQVRKP